MSKAKYTKLVKELHQGLNEAVEDMAGMGIGAEDMVFDIAENTLYDEVWIAPYLKKTGVSDIKGRLADDIYSGRS